MFSCRICGEEKDRDSFYMRKDSGKLLTECKECHYKRTAEWQSINKDKVRAYVRKSCKKAYDADPEKFKEKAREKRTKNPELHKLRVKRSYEKMRSNLTEHEKERRRRNAANFRCNNITKVAEYQRNWKQRHPEKHCAKQAKRRAQKNNATPTWLTSINLMQIQWYYDAAKMMTETSGVPHEVDHIHPLKGKGFNGLHVPWNLQVLTASDNRKKHNNFKEF